MSAIYEGVIGLRNLLIGVVYRYVLKPILFLFDPENVHDLFTFVGRILGSNPITRLLTKLAFGYRNRILEQEVAGIKFKNPIGLAAGFDKDALLTGIIPAVGFGFEEVGSITGEPCVGNPRPRLWRLKKSRSLVVYYGLKNEGCERIAPRLRRSKLRQPVGTSIAMTNIPKTLQIEAAIADYVKSFQTLADVGSYFTINISCPNSYCGQPFHDPENLELLLSAIDRIETKKPVFIKITPDLSFTEVDDILDVAIRHKVTGFICTNLTKKRDLDEIIDNNLPDVGGLSGLPVKNLSDEQIRHIYRRAGSKFVIIGCGGIFTAEDAYRKIRLGATLVQMITGMIFDGPQQISAINQGLASLLKRDGFQNINEAVGIDNLV